MNEQAPATPREQAELNLIRLMIEKRKPVVTQDYENIAKQAQVLTDSIFRNRKNQAKSDA